VQVLKQCCKQCPQAAALHGMDPCIWQHRHHDGRVSSHVCPWVNTVCLPVIKGTCRTIQVWGDGFVIQPWTVILSLLMCGLQPAGCSTLSCLVGIFEALALNTATHVVACLSKKNKLVTATRFSIALFIKRLDACLLQQLGPRSAPPGTPDVTHATVAFRHSRLHSQH